MDYPFQLTSQLREHLRALRKSRGLTQAALGERMGVGQARIAEIEANPGAVSIEQLMRLLSALGASLVLKDGAVAAGIAQPQANTRPPVTPPTSRSGPPPFMGVQQPLPGARNEGTSAVEDPPANVRDFVIRPGKGSW